MRWNGGTCRAWEEDVDEDMVRLERSEKGRMRMAIEVEGEQSEVDEDDRYVGATIVWVSRKVMRFLY